ncbi:MAG: hypothetical protein M1501_02885 [Candidatus Omnitrophica bacterium]|nr:hypothetical protein [Candidatus Omnitrophota bacterium]
MKKERSSFIARRSKLVKKLSRDYEMICGLYSIHRRCGKAGCKCQKIKNYKHNPVWCFHYKEGGKTKAEYIPAKYAERVKKQAQQYKDYKTISLEICNINRELLKMEIKKG